MKNRIIFECHFEAPTHTGPITDDDKYPYATAIHIATSDPDDDDSNGIGDFVRGFWINDKHELVHHREDCMVWIPPHKVQFIRRQSFEVADAA